MAGEVRSSPPDGHDQRVEMQAGPDGKRIVERRTQTGLSIGSAYDTTVVLFRGVFIIRVFVMGGSVGDEHRELFTW